MVTITKAEYDAAIKALLYKQFDTQDKNIETPILHALKDARLGEMSLDEIDGVFLVGGMTYYPTIQSRIYEIFNKRIKPIQSINPMLSVSRGAAIYHQQLGAIRYNTVDQLDESKFVTVPKGTIIAATVPSNIYIDVAGATQLHCLKRANHYRLKKRLKINSTYRVLIMVLPKLQRCV